MTAEPTDSRILVVDDEDSNLLLLTQVLTKAGYNSLRTLSDPRQVMQVIAEWVPDLLLLDLHMPNVNGIAVVEAIRENSDHRDMPVVVITADATAEARTAALEAGATDFLLKPIDILEVTLRTRNLLRVRKLNRQLTEHAALLESRVAARTAELAASQNEILARLALAGEYRDDITGRHTQRVGALSVMLATGLEVSAEQIEIMRSATPLHDIGKIGIPDSILLKPGPLSPDEYEEVKKHVTVGAAILSGGSSEVLRMAEEVALTHHERWDGTGYLGMAGTSIPRISRIVAVADVFDALTSTRPYKVAWPFEQAVDEIAGLSGSHFDPSVVEVFLNLTAEEPQRLNA